MHLIIQEARIPHLPLFTDIDSFLGVDEYVVHLYDKYGEGGGMLSKKTFAQVTMYRALYWDWLAYGHACFWIYVLFRFFRPRYLLLLLLPPAVGRTSCCVGRLA